MLLPSVQPGSGPFPASTARWIGRTGLSPGERTAAASFYLAMMTATCLALIGAEGPIIVEGPFARNRLFGWVIGTLVGAAFMGALPPTTGWPLPTGLGGAIGGLIYASNPAQNEQKQWWETVEHKFPLAAGAVVEYRGAMFYEGPSQNLNVTATPAGNSAGDLRGFAVSLASLLALPLGEV